MATKSSSLAASAFSHDPDTRSSTISCRAWAATTDFAEGRAWNWLDTSVMVVRVVEEMRST